MCKNEVPPIIKNDMTNKRSALSLSLSGCIIPNFPRGYCQTTNNYLLYNKYHK